MKVIFNYSGIYFEYLYRICNEEIRESKGFEEKILELQKKWDLEEDKILGKIDSLIGLKWKKEIIYAYLLPNLPNYNAHSISDPLTIPMKFKKNHQILERNYSNLKATVVHEILHTLLYEGDWNKKEFYEYYKRKYPNLTKKTIIHIPIHAILKELYLTLLGEEGLKLDLRLAENNKEYKIAWDIVENEGHKNIIERIKSLT